MPWHIDHFETDGDTIHVTRVRFEQQGQPTEPYQLQTAIAVPPPGPGHGQAIAALKQTINALRNPPDSPDVSDIEDALNTP